MRPSRPPTPPPPPPRDSKFGELTLVERIAVGGMAELFRAREPRAAGEPRTVVVKRMLPHIAREPGAARMFEAEARIGRLVTHPNVVTVLGSGEADGQPYLCLEWIPGVDLWRLRRWLDAADQTLEHPVALHVAQQMLAGLHAVHEATDERGRPLGVVHGDVSPSNVLLSLHGDVKLADLGVAQARLRSSFPQAAAAAGTRGKLAYLSPEQVRGEPHDRRSDVFAAAALIAELLIGAPLFARESDLSTLLAVRDAHIEPLTARAARLPPGLLEVLARGLARDPDTRWPSAAAFAEAIAPCAGAPGPAPRARLAELVRAASTQIADAPPPLPRDEVTVEPPLNDHWVRTGDGRELGPWSFAQLMEALTVGQLRSTDEVRTEGGRWRRIDTVPGLSAHLPRAQRATQPAPAPTVDLATGGIVTALARAAAERTSGVWVCERGDARTEIYLVDGTPEFVSSNVSSELLGEFLVARGALDRSELDMALAVLPRFDGRLGDTLSALGLMEPVELFRYITEQVQEKLLALFTWPDGRARFSPEIGPPEHRFPLGLDPWRILLEGIERRLSSGIDHEMFAAHITDDLQPGGQPVPAGAPAELEHLALLVPDLRPLQDVVEALADPSERDVHRPYRAVRLGLALGVVAWADA